MATSVDRPCFGWGKAPSAIDDDGRGECPYHLSQFGRWLRLRRDGMLPVHEAARAAGVTRLWPDGEDDYAEDGEDGVSA